MVNFTIEKQKLEIMKDFLLILIDVELLKKDVNFNSLSKIDILKHRISTFSLQRQPVQTQDQHKHSTKQHRENFQSKLIMLKNSL